MGDSRLGLVMVHGIMSGPQVWEPLRRLIAADRDLDFVAPLAFEYATGLFPVHPLRVLPSIETVADSLKEYLATEAGAFDKLMLVTHSQGGLVAQRYLARMLQDGRGAELARIQRLVMIACPSNGSELFLSLRRRALGLRHPQEKDLRPLSDQVSATLRTVLRDVVHATAVTERTCPIPVTVYAGESDGVVSRASAQSVFPDSSALPGDHSSILKADSPRHRTFTALRRLLLATPHEPPASGPGAPRPFPPPPAPWDSAGAAVPDRKRRRRTIAVASAAAVAVAVPVLLLAPLPWTSAADTSGSTRPDATASGSTAPDCGAPGGKAPAAGKTDAGAPGPAARGSGGTPEKFPATNAFWLVDINESKADYVTVDACQRFQFWWNGGVKNDLLLFGEKGRNSYTPDPGARGEALRFGDIDGDGWPDCLVTDRTGGLTVHTWIEDNPEGARMCMRRYDGVADVFTHGSTGEKLDIGKGTQIQFADLNGDKKVDYLLVEPDGTVRAWYNKGRLSENGREFLLEWSPPQQIASPLAKPHPLMYADINGDGKADQILLTPGGGARAWINKGYEEGTEAFDIGEIVKDTGAPPEEIQFADVDGDGRDDFTYIEKTGVVHVRLNRLTDEDFRTFHS
ncbi:MULTISPECIES: FG-GAP-like repeat-containing protein [Streptomyces]|uniref:FG-GAP-like repeat-containing protein n=1 Tax=Streptomyces ramulosus TaxID=47762 RepID=A0ABW1FEM6_9ACTN